MIAVRVGDFLVKYLNQLFLGVVEKSEEKLEESVLCATVIEL
jgi:hypothetical protein